MPLAPIERRFLKSLRESELLAPGDRVGIAVSGGADSVALLRLLHSLRARLGITLAVLHFDHCLRGAASQEDAQFVADLAASLGLEFVLDRQDVGAAALRHKWNLEDAGRRLRYAFFERLASENRVARVAVAHTMDDQAETVLARLIRGTGPAGLAAIYPATGSPVGAVVRPLLGHRREELRHYLRDLRQPWREDATNRDVKRLRAHIRERLLPIVEAEFSPRIVNHLAELARLTREQEVFWDALAEDRLASLASVSRERASMAVLDLLSPLFPSGKPCLSRVRPRKRELDSHAESQRPFRALTERIIRKMYAAVRGELRELSATHVEQVIRLVSRSTSGHRIELPGGISAHHDLGQLIFLPAASGLSAASTAARTTRGDAGYAYTLRLPERGSSTVSVPELHTSFFLKVIDWPGGQRETRMDCGALDAERLRSPLILRNWRPGDSYRPRERRHDRKLKEMLREARISVSERVAWPVLESDGRIVWARGLPPVGDFCAREDTRVGVLIEMDTHSPVR
jgi:tRNA(Ile)-lysidine synthase